MDSFDLDLLLNPDTFWQHVIMVAIACILGCMIGVVYSNKTIRMLKIQLEKLDKDLQSCEDLRLEVQKGAVGANLSQSSFPGKAENNSNPPT
jgi:cell division protein FtsL